MGDRAEFTLMPRLASGFRSVDEMAALAATSRVFDPASTLIAKSADIGGGNTFYPAVVIEVGPAAKITIGEGNMFWPGTTIVARSGRITIGSRNEFGPGGVTLVLEAGEISIGDDGRYREGAVILADCRFGNGAQVLGPIQAQGCFLDGGGSHRDQDPDSRGVVLKGSGRARGLRIGRGKVILGNGSFDARDLKAQSYFHPSAPGA